VIFFPLPKAAFEDAAAAARKSNKSHSGMTI
jgi:hypothetical protein